MRTLLDTTVALLIVCASSTPVVADQADITVSNEIDPMIVSGEFQGCDIVFSVMHSDSANFEGATVLVSGDIHIGKIDPTNRAVLLKVGVGATKTDPDGKLAVTYQAPTSVVLIDGLSTNKSDLFGTVPADTPGYRLMAYRYGQATAATLMTAAATGKLSLSYQLGSGVLGSNVDIDMTVLSVDAGDPAKSARNANAGRQLGECISAINR